MNPSEAPATPPAKILVPTDFTTESRAAIDYAMSLGEPLHADVDLLHVQRYAQVDDSPTYVFWNPMGAYAVYDEPAPALLREEVLAAFADSEPGHRMAECLKDLDGREVEARGRIAFGDPRDPADTIIAVATEAHYDLIVMATHGKGHLFTHGVAERVVRGAPCPVVTIRVRHE